jgi:hypothetical protein
LVLDERVTRPTVFELARVMGTSGRMIERHYGTLLDGAGPGSPPRLDALDALCDRWVCVRRRAREDSNL